MFRYSVICSFFLWAFTAQAQTGITCELGGQMPTVRANADRLSKELAIGNFSAVQRELDDRYRRYLDGGYSDLALVILLTVATKASAALEPIMKKWVGENPKSLLARIASASFHINMGYEKRGNKISRETSREQFEAMDGEMRRAMIDLEQAIAIDPNSILPYSFLIDIARTQAGPDRVIEILEKAHRLNSNSISPSYKAIFALSPEWGGSIEDIDSVVEFAVRTGMEVEKVKRLSYEAELHKASYFAGFGRSTHAELQHLKKATQLCPGTAAWYRLENAYYKLEDWSSVVDVNSRILQEHPLDGTRFQRRAYANEMLGKYPESVLDLQRAADSGEAWALNRLGYWSMTGQYMNRNLVKAREYLTKAARMGNANAPANLEVLSRTESLK